MLVLSVPQQGPSVREAPHCCYPPLPACHLSGTCVRKFSAYSSDPESSAHPTPWPSLDTGNTYSVGSLSPLSWKYPFHISTLPLGPSNTTTDCWDMGPKPPQPKHLPTALRLSLHHSFHHRTEVCKVLHTLWSQCIEEATA